MDIIEAHRVIQAEAAKLTAALHAKGYLTAAAEIWIARHGGDQSTVYVVERPSGLDYIYRNDFEALLKDMQAAIAALPIADGLAYAAELSGPLYLRSDRVPPSDLISQQS